MIFVLSLFFAQETPDEDCPAGDECIEIAESAGILGAMSEEPTDVFGSSGLDPDITGGIGGLIGAKGTQIGSGGLGDSHSAVDCVDDACSTHSGYGARVTTALTGSGAVSYGDPIILGALDRSVMQDVVDTLPPAWENCAATHGGTGKVTIKFVVAKDGSVSTSSVKSSTTRNGAVDACIADTFMHASFPPPKGGGIVIASWPILLAP